MFKIFMWFQGIGSVGITAGASGPEELVKDVIKYLEDLGGVFIEELRIIEEHIRFPYTLNIQS